MNLDKLLTNVTVIGAAGKMGSGIASLLCQEVARLKIKNPDTIYRINLIDINEQSLDGLRKYIKTQAIKMAEKSIVSLRTAYDDRDDLVENWEIIDEFVEQSLSPLRFSSDLSLAKNSNIIFEAIIENPDLKINILKELKTLVRDDTLFFTNTSSIPISYLDNQVKLNGRIIGYHFYNPPIVQKLVEIITAENTLDDLKKVAGELGQRLRKKLVPANDIAGFIGNGHFMRDGLHALAEVEKFKTDHTFPEAIYLVNKVSQDFLIRPMGIFQLIDYVGIDVFQCILQVMSHHLKDDSLHNQLIDTLMTHNIKGGQRSDGSQKDGFFQYEGNRPVAVYNIERNSYEKLAGFKEKIERDLGTPPEGFLPWKKLLVNPDKQSLLSTYFSNLVSSKSPGAEIATNYLRQSKTIGENLIKDGAANSSEDVNEVLINGFYWLYGPINDYV